VQASFVVPSTTGFGPLNLTVEQDGVSQKITLFYQGASDFPVSTKPASEICAGEKFYDASGSLKVGTRSCNGPNLSQLTPGNIKSGITIAGVTGTVVPAPADCSSDGQIGCRTTAAFKAANVSSVSAWDLRVGRTLAGVSGFLKTNCRNTVSDSVYNFDFTTSISELDETATTTGLAPDFWDTSDDDSGFSTTAVSGWPAASTCGADTFTDVSTTDGGTTLISCSSSTCIYKDNVTNLQFTAPLSAADIDITDTTDADIDWANAVRACHDSEYGGHAPGAWRLPTQKELMSIYAHGVAAISGAAGWSGKMDTNAYFWTATTNASNTSNAWKVWLKNGDVDNTSPKVDTHKVICVK
jgi:hypothetical protein